MQTEASLRKDSALVTKLFRQQYKTYPRKCQTVSLTGTKITPKRLRILPSQAILLQLRENTPNMWCYKKLEIFGKEVYADLRSVYGPLAHGEYLSILRTQEGPRRYVLVLSVATAVLFLILSLAGCVILPKLSLGTSISSKWNENTNFILGTSEVFG